MKTYNEFVIKESIQNKELEMMKQFFNLEFGQDKKVLIRKGLKFSVQYGVDSISSSMNDHAISINLRKGTIMVIANNNKLFKLYIKWKDVSSYVRPSEGYSTSLTLDVDEYSINDEIFKESTSIKFKLD